MPIIRWNIRKFSGKRAENLSDISKFSIYKNAWIFRPKIGRAHV